MRRYYDAQGSPAGTSQGTPARIFGGCLGLFLLVLLIGGIIALAGGH